MKKLLSTLCLSLLFSTVSFVYTTGDDEGGFFDDGDHVMIELESVTVSFEKPVIIEDTEQAKEIAPILQKYARGKKCRTAFLKQKQATATLQSWFRRTQKRQALLAHADELKYARAEKKLQWHNAAKQLQSWFRKTHNQRMLKERTDSFSSRETEVTNNTVASSEYSSSPRSRESDHSGIIRKFEDYDLDDEVIVTTKPLPENVIEYRRASEPWVKRRADTPVPITELTLQKFLDETDDEEDKIEVRGDYPVDMHKSFESKPTTFPSDDVSSLDESPKAKLRRRRSSSSHDEIFEPVTTTDSPISHRAKTVKTKKPKKKKSNALKRFLAKVFAGCGKKSKTLD